MWNKIYFMYDNFINTKALITVDLKSSYPNKYSKHWLSTFVYYLLTLYKVESCNTWKHVDVIGEGVLACYLITLLILSPQHTHTFQEGGAYCLAHVSPYVSRSSTLYVHEKISQECFAPEASNLVGRWTLISRWSLLIYGSVGKSHPILICWGRGT